MGGSAGGGAGRTAGVFGVPPKPAAAYAGTLTAAVGTAISTPATAIFLMLLRTPDDIVQVIDHSLHRVVPSARLGRYAHSALIGAPCLRAVEARLDGLGSRRLLMR